jgi:putative MATE family efflux protein
VSLSIEVRRLAVPAILNSFLQTLVFVVDRIMLGHHGEATLAAMQIGGTLEWSIWSVFVAFEVGTVARVGRLVGAGDREGARRVVWLSLGLAAGLGTLLALATPLVLHALPHLGDRVSPAARGAAAAYLGVTLAASPACFIAATSIASLQAGGDTRTPLAIGVVANVIHIATNRVLILGAFGVPALGARGAGISTAITFAIEAVLATAALTSLRRPVSLRRPPPSATTPSAATIKDESWELVRIGGPAFVERVLYHLGYLAYVLLVTRLGDTAMAANQSLISIESMCFLSGDGFGVAGAALVAQKLGAKKVEEAHEAASIAARYAVVTLTTCGLVALAMRSLILPLFSNDVAVIAAGSGAMPVLALAQPFMAIGIVLAASLRGAGRTRHALGVSFTGVVFVRLAATWLFAFGAGLGLTGVWLGSTTDWMVRTVLLLSLFRRQAFARREAARS